MVKVAQKNASGGKVGALWNPVADAWRRP